MAKDVAEVLGYADTDKAIRTHCKCSKLFKPAEMAGMEIPPRGVACIPERDIYRLVMKSKLPSAEKFEEWVVSLNLNRRHLSASQKAAVAHEMLPLLEAEAKERMRAGGGDKKSEDYQKSGVQQVAHPIEPSPRSVEAAAKAVGVNKKYVSDMKTIAREAPGKVEQIKKGGNSPFKLLLAATPLSKVGQVAV